MLGVSKTGLAIHVRSRVRRIVAVSLALGLSLSVGVAPARSQGGDRATEASLHVGPVAVTPLLRLTSIGVDSNVFNSPDDPQSDYTFTFQPQIDAWLTMGPALVSLDNRTEFVYYHRFKSEGGFNTTNGIRLDIPFNRVKPYATYGLLNSKERSSPEFDLRARRLQHNVSVGSDTSLSRRTSIDVSAAVQSLSYDQGQVFEGQELRSALNRRVHTARTAFIYRVSPLTTVTFAAEAERTLFDFRSERDSTAVRVLPGVEFQPSALIRGRAQVGVLSFKPDDPTIPAVTGWVSELDLGYVLLDRTQFGIAVRRGVTYSAENLSSYFIDTALRLSLVQQITERWQAQAAIVLQNLDYRESLVEVLESDPDGVVSDPRRDTLSAYQAGLGYRFAQGLRLSFIADYSQRASGLDGRGYDRLRFFGSVDVEV